MELVSCLTEIQGNGRVCKEETETKFQNFHNCEVMITFQGKVQDYVKIRITKTINEVISSMWEIIKWFVTKIKTDGVITVIMKYNYV